MNQNNLLKMLYVWLSEPEKISKIIKSKLYPLQMRTFCIFMHLESLLNSY